MSDPEKTPPHAPEEPARDRKGKWLPNTPSPNPGGRSKVQREARAAFLDRLPRALELVDAWFASSDFEQQRAAVEVTFMRALGKPAKPSEMPALEPPGAPTPEDADTGAMLVRVRGMIARGISVLEGQQDAGELGADGLESLGRLGQTLGSLVETEAKASRASKLSALSVDELLALIPEETLRTALDKRNGGGA